MRLTRLKAVLSAALVAVAGASAHAGDAPEEEVVAFGEREFWLGGDEEVVASGEGGFWLGPDEIAIASGEGVFWLGPGEIAVASGEKEFPLVVFRALKSDGDIADALRASGAVDRERILQLIGSSPDAYRAFKAWAEGNGHDDIAVAASGHAGDSFAFGVKDLFENAPEVRFTDVSVNTNASGTLDVTVTVKDGDEPKPVKSENVAQMFEATTNVADWTEGRVEAEVADRTGTKEVTTPVKFTVTPGGGTSEKAFLRIRK